MVLTIDVKYKFTIYVPFSQISSDASHWRQKLQLPRARFLESVYGMCIMDLMRVTHAQKLA